MVGVTCQAMTLTFPVPRPLKGALCCIRCSVAGFTLHVIPCRAIYALNFLCWYVCY